MEFRNGEESGEPGGRAEESKTENEKVFFGNETKDTEFNSSQSKSGAVAPKPSDVRNGDLVSLLLAATPPYLYNIPLVPQTFFFSEMLKSFVQAKAERQNLKSHQTHHRRQRKRSWREVTPPKPLYECRDKPLELTTPKQMEDKPKAEKSPVKKFQPTEGGEKKVSELGNFSVEKLANSSIASGLESNATNANSGDVLPPAPPLWYPLLYPPHPPYGIDPLHFFIDLRVGKLLEVSAHFWDRTAKLNNLGSAPVNLHNDASESPLGVGKARHCSAFRVPSPRNDGVPFCPKEPKRRSRNVHYVISSLKEIYKSLERVAEEKEKEEKGEEEGKRKREREREREREDEGEEENGKWQKNKDLRALIGLELVVDYVKQESDGEDEKSDVTTPEYPEHSEQEEEFRTLAVEQ